MTHAPAPGHDVPAWRQFRVGVARTRPLTPHLIRVTMTGQDLDLFADNGFDQRFKLILPSLAGGFDDLPDGPGWLPQLRRLPVERRNPVRTYTVRAVRPGVREVDVDMVVHGDGGPASRWAEAAAPGDAAVLLGPDVRHAGDHGGVEFRVDPAAVDDLLVAGDETALPAIAAILEQLPSHTTGTVFVEVGEPADQLELLAPEGMRLHWLPRAGSAHGVPLTRAVGRWRPRNAGATHPGAGADRSAAQRPESDVDVLWDVPQGRSGGPDRVSCDPAAVQAWVAGEASAVRTIRRHLVDDLGMPKRRIAFMGYWRQGRPGA